MCTSEDSSMADKLKTVQLLPKYKIKLNIINTLIKVKNSMPTLENCFFLNI